MSSPRISRAITRHVRDRCLCLRVQRAARGLGRHFDEAFRPLGLTNGQFSLMMSLNRPAPPTIGEAAEFLAMDRTTLTAALKPLERNGLVRVIANPHDRRSRLMTLTDAGRELLARAIPVWERTHADLDRLLGAGPGDRDRLRKDLDLLSTIGHPRRAGGH